MKPFTADKTKSLVWILAIFSICLTPVTTLATANPHFIKEEKSLTKILEEFGKKYEVFFSFEEALLSGVKVDFEFRGDESISQAIDRLLAHTDLQYEAYDNKYFVIYEKTKSSKKGAKKVLRKFKQIEHLQKANGLSVQQVGQTRLDKLHAMVDAVVELKEDQVISGTVKDADGQPLVGATVIALGTSIGTATDIDGSFSLSVPDDTKVLVVSYTGYSTQEVTIEGRTQIDVTLSSDLTTLEEVVVTGYGTQKKTNVTGSIVSVGAEDIARVQTPTFDAALQGKVPGVYVTSNGGQPGGGVFVRIRGAGTINNSNPLYVIDGVIVSAGDSENSNPLATINPNDIETIDILKDAASTAIYGARAANGVVLITTKRGKSGKPQVSYSAYIGIQEPASKLPRPMNAAEFAANMNEAFRAAGEEIPFANPSSLGEGTNWIDEVVSNGSIMDHQLSISGGSENNQYYVSMNYFDNQGIMLNTFQERFSFRANTDNQIGKHIKIGNSLAYSRGSHFNNNAGNRTFIHGAFTNLYQGLPTIPLYEDDEEVSSTGYGGPTDINLEFRRNQVSVYELPTRDNSTDRIFGNVYLEITPIKGLSLKTILSTDIQNFSNYNFEPIWKEGVISSGGLSTINQSRNSSIFWQWDNVLTYANSIDRHNFVLTAGVSAQESKFRSLNSVARYETNVFTEIVDGAKELTSNSNLVEESLASVFGRLNYDFDNKYLLTAAVRRDGSSKFGPTNKFGVFPSFTAGWRISQEDFFPGGFLSDLKIRGGWGQVGSDAIGNFRYLATLSSTFDYAFGNQTGVSSLGAALQDLANPGVKWETATEYSFGADFGFMQGRLTFSAEYFNRTRSDMLLVLQLPGISGLSTTVDNVGELVNKGLEFAVGYRKVDGDFRYDFNANLSTFSSEVIDLGGQDEIVAYTYSGSGATVVIRPGQPLGVFLARRTLGIFQTQEEVDAANALDGEPASPYQQTGTGPGDFKWADLNGDGVVTNADKEVVGSPIPDFTYGFGGTMQYKQLDLNFQFSGVQGNDIFHIARSQLQASGRAYNKSSSVVNAWSGPGTSNDIPRPHLQDPNQNIILGDHLIEDGSYLRLRTLQLGYHIPQTVLEPIGISSARIYLGGQNVFVLTKFTGIDPEVGLDENNSAAAGIYQDLYPQVRNWSFGINVGF
ncbi:MAG: SusC/RagA family TonB-linked outer membrane protein [Saprospiraceae bacterium]|nr:SusC/RagA family TonB-linked outer membrane protein [Saprospiraceae bacterium]